MSNLLTCKPVNLQTGACDLQPEERTHEELAHDDAGRDPRYHWTVLVAEAAAGDTPLMVGVAFIGQDTLAQREGAFEIDLRVRPDWQGRGVGKALYQAALAQLAPLAPRELSALKLRGIRYAQEHGNRRLWAVNDSVNAAMLALNHKLGFVRGGANIRYMKRLVSG